MSPVLLWIGSSSISPMSVPAGVKSDSHRFSACREKKAKLMPSGTMLAPSCMGEPGVISKVHFGESETFFMSLQKVNTTRWLGKPCNANVLASPADCKKTLFLKLKKNPLCCQWEIIYHIRYYKFILMSLQGFIRKQKKELARII